jgi:hypothetical protein
MLAWQLAFDNSNGHLLIWRFELWISPCFFKGRKTEVQACKTALRLLFEQEVLATKTTAKEVLHTVKKEHS